MKRIKLKTLMCGPMGTYQPGQEVEFDDKTAKMLVDSRQAEYVVKVVKKKDEELKQVLDDVEKLKDEELTKSQKRRIDTIKKAPIKRRRKKNEKM
jgi:uncharacterized protein (DUF2344 family)